MIVHDTPSDTIVHGFFKVVAPWYSWQHRDSCVVDAFATKFCQHIRSLSGTVHFATVLCRSVVVGEFGSVPLRENVSGILMLLRPGGHQLVRGP